MSATLSRIDPDQLNLRKVQNVVSNKTTPSSSGTSLPVSPLGDSKISTLSEAVAIEPVAYVPLRPELIPGTVKLEDGEQLAIQKFLSQATAVATSGEAPRIKEAYLKVVLKLHNLVEEVAANHIGHISQQIRQDSSELEQLNMKKTEEIRKHVLQVANDPTWSFLSNIFQYFLSAASVVLGGTLVATGVGATAGAFLIAAGGLGLLNSVGKDTGAFQAIASYFTKSKEMQEKIASWITTTILFATIGLGITGGVMSSFTPGIEAAQASMTAVDAAKNVEIAIGVASAGISVGKAISDKNTAQIQKSLQHIEGRIFLMKKDLERWGSEAKSTINMMQTISTQTRQAITAFQS